MARYATSVDEIDRVLVTTKQKTRRAKCARRKATYPITTYERRTGKVIATKDFDTKPSITCDPDAGSVLGMSGAPEAGLAWARAQLTAAGDRRRQ